MEGEDKQAYIDRHIEAAKQYAKDVLNGDVIVNKYIKKAVLRQEKLADKYFICEKEAKKFFSFAYYLKLSKAGQKPTRFHPAPYQSWIFYNIFSYFKDEACTRRLFRDVTIFISRKAGKTTIAAILALYELLKGDRNTEGYVLSLTRDQASQGLRYAKQIVKDSKALRKRVDVRQHYLQTTHNGTSIFKSLPAKADRLLGLSPGIIVVDEYSVFPSKDEVNAMTTGTLAHPNAMVIYITTASFYKDYPFYTDEYNLGKRVLDGEDELDTAFWALYELDDDKEEEDSTMWVKANPSIGVTMELETLEVMYDKAKRSVTDLVEFQTKNLNIWADNAEAWVLDADIKKVFKSSDYDKLKGKPAYLGLDLSATKDLAALVAIVEDDGHLHTFPYFFFPNKDNERNRIRKSGIDLQRWIDKDYIISQDSRTLDYDQVYDKVVELTEHFEVKGLSYDKWNAQMLINKIENNLFIDLIPAPQNASFFNGPMKFLERVIIEKGITLSSNPVLRWNFRNVVISYDINNNVRPVKNKSNDSIDGVVALIEAIGAYISINYDTYLSLLEQYNETLKK